MCSHRYRYIKIYVSCGLQLLLELKSFQSNLHVHIPLPKDGDVMRCVFVADVDSCEKGMLIVVLQVVNDHTATALESLPYSTASIRSQ